MVWQFEFRWFGMISCSSNKETPTESAYSLLKADFGGDLSGWHLQLWAIHAKAVSLINQVSSNAISQRKWSREISFLINRKYGIFLFKNKLSCRVLNKFDSACQIFFFLFWFTDEKLLNLSTSSLPHKLHFLTIHGGVFHIFFHFAIMKTYLFRAFFCVARCVWTKNIEIVHIRWKHAGYLHKSMRPMREQLLLLHN